MIRILLLFALSSAAIYEVSACSCAAFPLQKLFCDSDFVIKIKVEDVTKTENMFDNVYYQVDVLTTYKATDEAKAALKLKKLTTYPLHGACGLELEQNQVVIVGGNVVNGQPIITICNLNIRNQSKMEAEENNLRENFPKSCTSV